MTGGGVGEMQSPTARDSTVIDTFQVVMNRSLQSGIVQELKHRGALSHPSNNLVSEKVYVSHKSSSDATSSNIDFVDLTEDDNASPRRNVNSHSEASDVEVIKTVIRTVDHVSPSSDIIQELKEAIYNMNDVEQCKRVNESRKVTEYIIQKDSNALQKTQAVSSNEQQVIASEQECPILNVVTPDGEENSVVQGENTSDDHVVNTTSSKDQDTTNGTQEEKQPDIPAQDPTEDSEQNLVNEYTEESEHAQVFMGQLPPYEPILQAPEYYTCEECGDKFALSCSLSRHTDRRSVLITYSCEDCSNIIVFYNRCNFLAHLRQHPITEGAKLSVRPLPVEYLDLNPPEIVSVTGSSLFQAIVASYPPVDTGEKTRCYECKELFPTLESYKSHFIGDKNIDDNCSKCDSCQLILPNNCNLLAHKRYHEHKKPYICPDCSEKFIVWTSFSLHLTNKCFHTQKQMRYKCVCCKLVFQASVNLNVHILNTHIRHVYKCGLCPIACYNLRFLQYHNMKVHKNQNVEEIPYNQCQLCPDRLIAKNRVMEHVSIHSRSNKYQAHVYVCDYCKCVLYDKENFCAHRANCIRNENKDISANVQFAFKALKLTYEGLEHLQSTTLKKSSGALKKDLILLQQVPLAVSPVVPLQKTTSKSNGVLTPTSSLQSLPLIFCMNGSPDVPVASSRKSTGSKNKKTVSKPNESSKNNSVENRMIHNTKTSVKRKLEDEPLSNDKRMKMNDENQNTIESKAAETKFAAEPENPVEKNKISCEAESSNVCVISGKKCTDENEATKDLANDKQSEVVGNAMPLANEKEIQEQQTNNLLNNKAKEVEGCAPMKSDDRTKVAEASMSSGTDTETNVRNNSALAHKKTTTIEDNLASTFIDIKTEVVDLCYSCGEPITDNDSLQNHGCFSSMSTDGSNEYEAFTTSVHFDDPSNIKNKKLPSDRENVHGTLNNDSGYIRMTLDLPSKKYSSETEDIKLTWYRCHLCNDRLLLERSIIQKHFAEEHIRLRFLGLSPRVEKLKLPTVPSSPKKIASVPSQKDIEARQLSLKGKRAPRKQRKKHISPFKSGMSVTSSSSASNFECSKCNFTSTNKAKFQTHIKVHCADNSSFQCSECGHCFVVEPSLVKHLFVSHRIKDPTPYLEKASTSGDAIAHSNSAHSVQKKLRCKVCYETFEDQLQLDKHFRVHGMAFLLMKRHERKT